MTAAGRSESRTPRTPAQRTFEPGSPQAPSQPWPGRIDLRESRNRDRGNRVDQFHAASAQFLLLARTPAATTRRQKGLELRRSEEGRWAPESRFYDDTTPSQRSRVVLVDEGISTGRPVPGWLSGPHGGGEVLGSIVYSCISVRGPTSLLVSATRRVLQRSNAAERVTERPRFPVDDLERHWGQSCIPVPSSGMQEYMVDPPAHMVGNSVLARRAYHPANADRRKGELPKCDVSPLDSPRSVSSFSSRVVQRR